MTFKEITFYRTGHTLLNNGIIGVYEYLNKANEEASLGISFDFELQEDCLKVQSDNLKQLLEDIYYWMGRDYYDTYTLKQQQNSEKLKECNVYYDESRDKFIPFPKMNTYGLTELLTNNTQGVTRDKKSTVKKAQLKENDPEKFEKFKTFFEKHNLKWKDANRLYVGERYTKITRLGEINEDYLTPGKNQCYLTGESFKKLVDVKNISPFISSLITFNSRFAGNDKKISWKALYLSRFAPVKAFYHYPNKLREGLYVYLFSSNNLKNLEYILDLVDLRKDNITLRSEEFLSNIKFDDILPKDFFTEQNEVALILIYAFYKKVIKKYGELEDENESLNDDLFSESFKLPPFSIVNFKAEQFASTLRPNKYENINRLHTIINMFFQLERAGIQFNKLLPSFKIIKPSERSNQNKMRLERALRNQIAERFLKGRTTVDLIEELMMRSYSYISSNENIGFKDFNQIFKFFKLHEQNLQIMDEKLQEYSLTLGKQIGTKMRNHDNTTSEKDNAKKARGDLISLRKARTKKQFLDELIRIDFKYGLTINEELAQEINDQNYYNIKQFLIIGALNILNPAIHDFKQTQKTA